MKLKYFVVQGAAMAAVVGLSGISASASRLGHAGYSTTGATASQTQWNLICDPQYAENGLTSTAYTGFGVASISEIIPEAPFKVTDLEVQLLRTTDFSTFFVDFKPNAQGIIVVDRSQFVDSHGVTGVDAGFLQVAWSLVDPNIQPPDATDDNTHMLVFDNMSGNPNESATFRDYADPGVANGGHSLLPDFYSGVITDDSGNPQNFTFTADPNDPTHTTFDTNTVTYVVGTPEPSSIALLGLAGVGLLKRRRK